MVCVGSVMTTHIGALDPDAFKHTGICQRSFPAEDAEGSRKKRCCESLTDVLPFAHDVATSTCGTPACSTNVPMMRSTGLPDAAVTDAMKSSDVAFAH